MVFAATSHRELPTKDILSWIFDESRYDQDKPILIDAANPTRSISFNQARKLVRQLAAGLTASGLEKGDCVCLHSFNDIYYPIFVLGVIASGGIFASTNPAYTQFELAYHIKTANPKILISEPEIFDPLREAAQKSGISPKNIWIFDALPAQKCPKGYPSWKALFTHGEADWVRFDDFETCQNTTAIRLFSSGTTGKPKATRTSHYNLIAEHELCFEGSTAKQYDVVNLYYLPLFHASVSPRVNTGALKRGEKSYIMRRFDLEMVLKYIKKYSVTDLVIVPPIALGFVMSPLSKKYSMASVKCAIAGAAHVSRDLQNRLQAVLFNAKTTQVLGITEATCIVMGFFYPEVDETGSVGRPIPNIDVKLVDDDGHEIITYNTEAEICIRGPTVISGYFENQEANASSFDADGFYHTGDVGYVDGKSKLWYIVDRKKELIKVRAFQVAPAEIEAVLLQHPDIIDAAVIGVPDVARASELPRAYVVRREGVDPDGLTEQAVKDFVAPKLAKFKALDGGVRFVQSIPKNPSGKILKRILREEWKKEKVKGAAVKL